MLWHIVCYRHCAPLERKSSDARQENSTNLVNLVLEATKWSQIQYSWAAEYGIHKVHYPLVLGLENFMFINFHFKLTIKFIFKF